MDIFLSHASEDKDAFVRPLAERLRQLGVSVWYDEFEIKPGESISASVDRGLWDAQFGVVVLSEAFFSKGWTRWELAGLVQRHLNSDRAMLIPVWHGLGAKRVAEFSPPLADMLAIKSSMGIESVARQIAALVLPPLVPLSVPAEWRTVTGPSVRRWTADNVVRILLSSFHRMLAPQCEVRLALFIPRGDYLELTAASPQRSQPSFRFLTASSFIGQAVRHGSVVLIPDAAAVSDPWVDAGRGVIASMLTYPILNVEEKLVGVFVADASSLDAFSTFDMYWLQQLSAVLIPFLEAARNGPRWRFWR